MNSLNFNLPFILRTVTDDLHHSCDMLVHVLQVGQEMLEQEAREAKEHDQKLGPTDTNGQPKPGSTGAHATDPGASTSSASTNNHSSKPIQAGSGRN